MSDFDAGDDALRGCVVSRASYHTGCASGRIKATVVRGPMTTPKRKSPVLVVLVGDRLAVWEIEDGPITVESTPTLSTESGDTP